MVARRVNFRAVKLHRSYSVPELAACFGVHKNTVRLWLARELGYKSHIAYADADYFSLSDRDVAVARARREKLVPTISQVELVLCAMPGSTIVQRRDRALIAFTMLTGARVGALASFRLATSIRRKVMSIRTHVTSAPSSPRHSGPG